MTPGASSDGPRWGIGACLPGPVECGAVRGPRASTLAPAEGREVARVQVLGPLHPCLFSWMWGEAWWVTRGPRLSPWQVGPGPVPYSGAALPVLQPQDAPAGGQGSAGRLCFQVRQVS